MKLYNILENGSSLLRSIKLDCQEFLEDSQDKPLIKWCSSAWPDVHRIKVRKRKHVDLFTEQFNSAFADVYPSILNRSVIINEFKNNDDDDQFYIFPIDGFKFMYCSEINNSKVQLSPVLDEIMAGMDDEGSGVIQDMLHVTYQEDNITEAIVDNVEIIIYNIPVFYAVRSNIDYSNVVDFNDEIIEIKDSRTIAMGQDRQIGLMPTFMLGGDLQRGQVVRSQVAAIGVLGAENEKKYLAEISGIVV